MKIVVVVGRLVGEPVESPADRGRCRRAGRSRRSRRRSRRRVASTIVERPRKLPISTIVLRRGSRGGVVQRRGLARRHPALDVGHGVQRLVRNVDSGCIHRHSVDDDPAEPERAAGHDRGEHFLGCRALARIRARAGTGRTRSSSARSTARRTGRSDVDSVAGLERPHAVAEQRTAEADRQQDAQVADRCSPRASPGSPAVVAQLAAARRSACRSR